MLYRRQADLSAANCPATRNFGSDGMHLHFGGAAVDVNTMPDFSALPMNSAMSQSSVRQ